MKEKTYHTNNELYADPNLVEGVDYGHCCIWRSLPSMSSTRALNALVDTQDDRFAHFLQPSGREAPPRCYPLAAPSAQGNSAWAGTWS